MSILCMAMPSSAVSSRSPSIKRKRGLPRMGATCSIFPLLRLSITITRSPRASSPSARSEPMQPAPPVTRTFINYRIYRGLGSVPMARSCCIVIWVLQSLRFGFLIAQHPAINHAVILREVRLLRDHIEIHTASILAPDRPLDQLSPEELDEAKRTFYVKPAGFGAALAALFRAFWLNPLRFTAGLLYAVRLAGFR